MKPSSLISVHSIGIRASQLTREYPMTFPRCVTRPCQAFAVDCSEPVAVSRIRARDAACNAFNEKSSPPLIQCQFRLAPKVKSLTKARYSDCNSYLTQFLVSSGIPVADIAICERNDAGSDISAVSNAEREESNTDTRDDNVFPSSVFVRFAVCELTPIKIGIEMDDW